MSERAPHKLHPATLARLRTGEYLRECTEGRGYFPGDGNSGLYCTKTFRTFARKGTVCPNCAYGIAARARHIRWRVRQSKRGVRPGARKPLGQQHTRKPPRRDGKYMRDHTCPGTIVMYLEGQQCGMTFTAGALARLCRDCTRQWNRQRNLMRDRTRDRGSRRVFPATPAPANGAG